MVTSVKQMIILSLVIVLAVTFGCKKSDQKTGIITLTLGSVRVWHLGHDPAGCKVKEVVKENDAIMTGPASMAVVQFSNNCVVQIQENTTFKVLPAGEKGRELFVKKGRVLTKLIKNEDAGLNILTPTAIAGVRGTRFSVNYTGGVTRVAVDEGKVAVKASFQDETGKTITEVKEETLTEAGKTAEVSAAPKTAGEEAPLTIKIRAINEAEVNVLKKFENVPIIDGVRDKSIEEIEDRIKKGIGNYTNDQQTRIKDLMAKKTRTLDEIRGVFNRVDEVTLYNGRVIQGAILSRGAKYTILTTDGIVTVMEDEIKNSGVAQ